MFITSDVPELIRPSFVSVTASLREGAIQDILSVFDAELGKQNTAALAKRLNDVDQAYGAFEIVRKASIASAKEAGDFTPGQLLTAVKAGDPTKRKSQFSRGEARLQETGQQAQDVMGSRFGDSGTAGRQEAAKFLTGSGIGYGLIEQPFTVGIPTAAATLSYTPLGVPVARTAIDLSGRALQQAVPVLSANINNLNITDNAKEMLSRVLSGVR